MHGRFDAVGRRFDEAEERLTRLERAIHEVKLDLLRMENGILSAQQSALQAHLRMDEPPAAGQT
jgi:predicted phage gp36 major capsid-like protein